MPNYADFRFHLEQLSDDDLAAALEQMRTTDKWPLIAVTTQLGAQLMAELERRQHNADESHATVPRESDPVGFNVDSLSAEDVMFGLALINERSRDTDIPEAIGQLWDHAQTVLSGIAGLYLHRSHVLTQCVNDLVQAANKSLHEVGYHLKLVHYQPDSEPDE